MVHEILRLGDLGKNLGLEDWSLLGALEGGQSTEKMDVIVGEDEGAEGEQPVQASDLPDTISGEVEKREIREVRQTLHPRDEVGRQVERHQVVQHLQPFDALDLIAM